MATSPRWPTAIWGGPKWQSWSHKPRLKLSTLSQMADSDLKVHNLKVCVKNAKFIVHNTNFRKFLNFGTLESC